MSSVSREITLSLINLSEGTIRSSNIYLLQLQETIHHCLEAKGSFTMRLKVSNIPTPSFTLYFAWQLSIS